MNIKELLPIGSIILLQEGTKKLMVFGVKQTDENTGKEYDYSGVIYPEGNIGNEAWFLFDHANIAEICFRGYEDDERTDFLEKLSDYYAEKSDDE